MVETIAFRSEYPDLDPICCAQIDQIFPRGSQSRESNGTIPLSRVAALGFHGLTEAIRLTPLEVQRIAGEMDVLAEKEGVAIEVASRLCAWLTTRGERVSGWPPLPRTISSPNTFSLMSNRNKARSLIETIQENRRGLFRQEKDWILAILAKITD